MGKNSYFEFVQFRIIQEKSAMKIGIDGVLLGAWIDLKDCNRILDVGAGTGLLSLMAAQRSQAAIDAVEIENEASSEARLNFSNSLWAERLTIFNTPFQNFNPEAKYNHVVSNPPFFDDSLKPNSDKRLKARHSDNLRLGELLAKSISLLKSDGKISLILPADKYDSLQELIQKMGLFLSKVCYVHPFETKKPNRILVELITMPCELITTKISIRNEKTNSYSDEFRDLTKDFYRSLN